MKSTPSKQLVDGSNEKGGLKIRPSDETVSELITWVGEAPGVLRGIAPIRRSAIGLGDEGASLLI